MNSLCSHYSEPTGRYCIIGTVLRCHLPEKEFESQLGQSPGLRMVPKEVQFWRSRRSSGSAGPPTVLSASWDRGRR